jgi:formylglycine-generating enzyme required for sulfatase activity/serine/threonine protein kinase
MATLNPRLADLSDDDRQVLESWLVEFDQRWDEGRLANRLDQIPPGSSWRLPALAEMVKIDLERQWGRGRQISLESYLEEFPELGSPGDVSIDLIQAEYEVRRQFGASLTVEDYHRRFPHMAGELARLNPQGDSALSRQSSVAAPSRSSSQFQKPAKTPEQLREQFGRYRIVRRLGQGGMGSVYLANDTHLQRPVALKVPDFGNHEAPEARRRFLEEARSAATLDHPYLCPVYDAGEIDGQPYLTMAYIEGQSLAVLIGDEGWPQRQVAALVGKLALALQDAHTRTVIHRDLKPANVMIKTTGGRREPVIVDFGLARRDNPEEQRLTKSGQIMGTIGYMAPEQIRGDLNEIGPACDIYALGVILYELLTGRLPFSGSGLAIAGEILTKSPLPPSALRTDLDPALEAICLKAMAKTKMDRYTSMSELAAALTGFLQSPSASPTQAASSGSTATPSSTSGERLQPAGSNSLVGQFLARMAGTKERPSPIPAPGPVAAPAPLRERRRPMWPMVVAAGVIGVVVLCAMVYVVTGKGRFNHEVRDLTGPAISDPVRPDSTAHGSGRLPPGPAQTVVGELTSTHVTAPSLAKEPASPPVIAKTNAKGEFQPLFNGKDLTGWVPFAGKPGHWRVENGILTGSGADWSSLWTVRDDCRDFHLRVEARISEGGDGGVFFRGAFPSQAYLVKIVGNRGNYQGSTGGLVSGTGKAIVPHRVRVVTPGEWLMLEVIAEGDNIVTKVNGETSTIYTDAKSPSRNNSIGLEQRLPATVIEFRKIEIKELDGTAGATGGLSTGPARTVVGEATSPPGTHPVGVEKEQVIAPRAAGSAEAKPPGALAAAAVLTPAPKRAEKPRASPLLRSRARRNSNVPLKEISNGIGIRLVLIPAGDFLMGSPETDQNALPREKPQHAVRINRPFYLGVYEVTQRQYLQVTGTNPSKSKGFDEMPVENVSWVDAIAFCNKLSEQEGLKPYYALGAVVGSGGTGYRLPTEAEWEYACRAGSPTRYVFGDTPERLGEFAWHGGNSDHKTHRVGLKLQNDWGLYDIRGNVNEWCWDLYDEGYYGRSPAADPLGPSLGALRVVRGTGCHAAPRFYRAANRGTHAPSDKNDSIGFRVARSLPGP